jgi:hypothetical protein
MIESDNLRAGEDQDDDSDPMANLLRRALADAPLPRRDFLPGVQKKIRVRTRGRFFRDRWSTSRNPVSLILMATLLLVILCAALFLVLQPLVDAPRETELNSPAIDPMAVEPKN